MLNTPELNTRSFDPGIIVFASRTFKLAIPKLFIYIYANNLHIYANKKDIYAIFLVCYMENNGVVLPYMKDS